MKKLSVLLMMLMLVFSLSACAQEVSQEDLTETATEGVEAGQTQEEPAEEVSYASEYPLTIVDHFDRQVVIESKPNKVITLAPSLTETIYALSAGDMLQGRTDYCTYPPEVSDVVSVGSLKDPSIEAIAEINPDVIFASTHFQNETLKKLEDLGFTVVILSAQDSFEGVYDVIVAPYN